VSRVQILHGSPQGSKVKISLVPDKQRKKFEKDVIYRPVDIYDMAVDILHPKWKRRPSLVQKLNFTYKPKLENSGHMEFTIDEKDPKEIYLNLAKIRTYRDLAYTLFHEWKHAMQLKAFGHALMFKMVSNYDKRYGDHPLEVDADQYAFAQENKMEYKNFVINPTVDYSLFVERKKLY
jgi:hypothetical protein